MKGYVNMSNYLLVNEYIMGDDSDDLSQDASVGASLPTDSEFCILLVIYACVQSTCKHQ